jgi:hypothetical protein
VEGLITIGKVIGGFLVVVLVMGAPFSVLSIVMDARQKARIRKRFAALGIPIDKIEIRKNHYGVQFIHGGSKFYVRCVPGSNGFKWIRETPPFLIQEHDTLRSS